MGEKIFVTQPSMPTFEVYVDAIRPLWDSRWLTNMGSYQKQLEKELKKYLDVPELSLMVNGHMALELAIQAFDFPENSEVITTPYTFVSTTHAIVRNHLIPIFCDVKPEDGTIDETQIEELITEKTVAIIPVHVYGKVCNVEAIEHIAYKYNLKVIYDAAHAFGVKYKGKGIGNYGDASVFSFHATKVYNTIEGGAVAFSDHKLYEKLYNLKNFGIRNEELVVAVGANAKMNEFCAIMGLCNLKYIAQAIDNRKYRYKYYLEKLKRIQGIGFFEEAGQTTKNYAYLPIIVEERYALSRDELYEEFRREDIYVRKYFYPITADEACFRNKYKKDALENARMLSKHVLILPLYEQLEIEQIDRVVQTIQKNSLK